jgi:hypothetical protein
MLLIQSQTAIGQGRYDFWVSIESKTNFEPSFSNKYQKTCKFLIDSLCKKYKIEHNNPSNKFLRLTSTLKESSFNSNIFFTYCNTTILLDATGKKELVRVDEYFKDLSELSKNYDQLVKIMYKSYEPIFKIFDQNIYQKINKNLLKLSFKRIKPDIIQPNSNARSIEIEIEDIIEKVFYECNKRFLSEEPQNTSQKIVMVHLANQSDDIEVSLVFPNSTLLFYENSPIQTSFVITKDNIISGDYSYLYGKLTTSLYKIVQVNFLK